MDIDRCGLQRAPGEAEYGKGWDVKPMETQRMKGDKLTSAYVVFIRTVQQIFLCVKKLVTLYLHECADMTFGIVFAVKLLCSCFN